MRNAELLLKRTEMKVTPIVQRSPEATVADPYAFHLCVITV